MGSFERFYRESADRCFRAVVAALGGRDLAEDALAEAYARALSRWDKLADHPNPEGWIVVTAINVQRSVWRRSRRPAQPASQYVNEPESIDSSLLDVVKRLPRRQQQVVALRLVLDLDGKTTGALLGISPSTVRVHLHRATRSLRLALEQSSTKKEAGNAQQRYPEHPGSA